MLHLDARVDLHEIEFVAIDVVEKLDRAGVAIADRRKQIDRRLCSRVRVFAAAPRPAPLRPSSDSDAAASNRARRNAERGPRRHPGPALRRAERARRSARRKACRRRKPPWPRSRRARNRPQARWRRGRRPCLARRRLPTLWSRRDSRSGRRKRPRPGRGQFRAARRHRDAGRCARRRAASLSPTAWIDSAVGPTKTIPSCSQSAASDSRSERNP